LAFKQESIHAWPSSQARNGIVALQWACCRGNSELQMLQQIGFQPDTAGAFLEMPAADQEGVFDPLAERGNLGGVQIGAMSASSLAMMNSRPGRSAATTVSTNNLPVSSASRLTSGWMLTSG
jgi:hypothetical protein